MAVTFVAFCLLSIGRQNCFFLENQLLKTRTRIHCVCTPYFALSFSSAEDQKRKASDVSRSTGEPRNLCNYPIWVHIGWEGNACTKAKKKRGRTKRELFGATTIQFRSTPRRHEIKTAASRGVLGARGKSERRSIEWEEPIHANERKRREERGVRSNRGGLMGWPGCKIKNKRNTEVDSLSLSLSPSPPPIIRVLAATHVYVQETCVRKIDPATYVEIVAADLPRPFSPSLPF